MKNKVLIRLIVPEIDEYYDIFVPVNVRIGTIIKLINKSLVEFTNGAFKADNKRRLYDSVDVGFYDYNDIIRKTNIRNGSSVIFM